MGRPVPPPPQNLKSRRYQDYAKIGPRVRYEFRVVTNGVSYVVQARQLRLGRKYIVCGPEIWRTGEWLPAIHFGEVFRGSGDERLAVRQSYGAFDDADNVAALLRSIDSTYNGWKTTVDDGGFVDSLQQSFGSLE